MSDGTRSDLSPGGEDGWLLVRRPGRILLSRKDEEGSFARGLDREPSDMIQDMALEQIYIGSRFQG